MPVNTLYGSRIMTGLVNTYPPQLADPGEGGGKVRRWIETVETTSTDSASSVSFLARLPSNARISGRSTVSWDQLCSTAGTAMVGIYNITGRSDITDAPSAFTTTALAISVAGSGSLITDIANYGKRLWEYTAATTDPKCDLEVRFKTATDNTVAGTVTVEIDYMLD